MDEQPEQQKDEGRPEATDELADPDLKQASGGSVSTGGSGGEDRLTENVTLNF